MDPANPIENPSYTEFRVLGVCGGIGSGKSTACKLLVSTSLSTDENSIAEEEETEEEEEEASRRALQCLAHIDADSIAHSVYAPGSQAVHDVVSEFGSGILLDGTTPHNGMEIDRKKLGAIVFADPSSMAKLEAVVWPHVKKLIIERIEGLRQEWETAEMGQTQASPRQQQRLPVVVLEAAVLLDAGWDDLLDGVWVVKTPTSVALQRLMETRGLSEEEARRRIDAQESRRGIGNTQDEIDSGIVTGVIENNGSMEGLKKSLQAALDDPTFWKQ